MRKATQELSRDVNYERVDPDGKNRARRPWIGLRRRTRASKGASLGSFLLSKHYFTFAHKSRDADNSWMVVDHVRADESEMLLSRAICMRARNNNARVRRSAFQSTRKTSRSI